MSEVSHAPWTEDQISSLNDYQASGRFHPFTCVMPGHGALTAITSGWICLEPDCRYRQPWAHGWMADRSWERT